MIFDTNNNLKNKMLFDKKTEFYLIKIAKKNKCNRGLLANCLVRESDFV